MPVLKRIRPSAGMPFMKGTKPSTVRDDFSLLKNAVKDTPNPHPVPLSKNLNMGPSIRDRWTEFRDNLSAKPHPRPTRRLADDSAAAQALIDASPNNPKGFGRTKGKRR